jgi:hypothetical protein
VTVGSQLAQSGVGVLQRFIEQDGAASLGRQYGSTALTG